MGRYLDIATSATQERFDEATDGKGSRDLVGSKFANGGGRSNKGDDDAVYFAVNPRQRIRYLLEMRGEPGETSESSEKSSGEFSPRCLHGATVVECALCSGYARWLIAGGNARTAEARRNPEAARRAFWREGEMGTPSGSTK